MKLKVRAAALLMAFTVIWDSAGPVGAQDRGRDTPRAEHAGLSIITLGTAGGPPPHQGRSQPATLLMVDGKKYLVDAGEAAGYQLLQAGVSPRGLDAVFITHLHWDHVLGLDYLMATEWMRERQHPLPVYGPPGLDFFISRLLATLEIGEDIFRSQASARPPLSSLYPSREIGNCAEHVVYIDEAVTVKAVCNSHFAEVRSKPHSYGEDRALSYRFDTPHGSVTFTGDTGPSSELEALAKGSDMLVAEIVDLPSIRVALEQASPGRDISMLLQHMEHQHLTPEEVGKLATRAEVRTVILTHFVVGRNVELESLGAQVREHFSGEVIVGRDLQVTSLTENR